MEEKMGKLFIDGRIVDLDETPIEDLKKMQKQIEQEIEDIRNEVNKLLN